jgi:hypothetical protein
LWVAFSIGTDRRHENPLQVAGNLLTSTLLGQLDADTEQSEVRRGSESRHQLQKKALAYASAFFSEIRSFGTSEIRWRV